MLLSCLQKPSKDFSIVALILSKKVFILLGVNHMMIQGIEDTLDEHNDIERRLDGRRRMGTELDTERSSNQLKLQNNYFPIAPQDVSKEQAGLSVDVNQIGLQLCRK